MKAVITVEKQVDIRYIKVDIPLDEYDMGMIPEDFPFIEENPEDKNYSHRWKATID